MKKLTEKEIEKMIKAFSSLKARKEEITVNEFAGAVRWKLDETIEVLKDIFENPEKYRLPFYVLFSPDNKKIFLR